MPRRRQGNGKGELLIQRLKYQRGGVPAGRTSVVLEGVQGDWASGLALLMGVVVVHGFGPFLQMLRKRVEANVGGIKTSHATTRPTYTTPTKSAPLSGLRL
jgi:hypothetical protein